MLPNLVSQASSMWEINQALRTLIEQNRWVYLRGAFIGESDVRYDRVTGARETLEPMTVWSDNRQKCWTVLYWKPAKMAAPQDEERGEP